MQSNISLKRWTPSAISPTSTVLLCAQRNAGKSTLLFDICYNLRHKVDSFIVFCPTALSSRRYMNCFPRCFVYLKFDPKKIEEILNRQKKQIAKGRAKTVMLLLDDCIFAKKMFNTEVIREVFLNGRHYKTGCILTSQYALALPTIIRSNLDVVISLSENIFQNRKRLHNAYFGVFNEFAVFQKVLQMATNKYGCLVYVHGSSHNIADCIFHYRANANLPYAKLGAPVYFDLSERYFKTSSSASGSTPAVLLK